MAHNAHLSQPDPELAALLAHIPHAPPPSDITVRRNAFNTFALPKIQAVFKTNAPDASKYRVEDHKVPVEGAEILVRAIIPTPNPSDANESQTYPLMVWMHPGGYVLGSIEMEDYLLRRISVEFQLTIVNVEYRLAPEFPYPTGMNDSYAALKWAASHTALLSASLDKGFIISGCSAGGNFAASLSIRARDDPFFVNRPLTGQLLQLPQVLHPEAAPERFKDELYSREQNKDAPLLTWAEVVEFTKIYKAPLDDPQYSVLLASDHRDLPPAYIQVCGLDTLRDEGLLYEKILRDAGVQTKLDVYPGLPHGGHILLPSASISVKVNKDFEKGLRWLLHRQESSA
ncbi:unnamed protein product [Somion occarium]|uniref:Alpha/beta hydrolase fold-3 domain-containing protein n=1 Tax=Somion occarium TaxID=3059160 RepID=A0ABP1E3R0_9APHY